MTEEHASYSVDGKKKTTKQVYLLINQDVSDNAERFLWECPTDGTWEVIFREVEHEKTLKQLGALFGLWATYIANRDGESVDYVHRMLKARFLARIYVMGPKTPEQEAWVELLAVYQEANQQDKLLKHAKRISLAWSTLPQMKEYMNSIEQHYQSIGEPLPVIDKHYKRK